MLPLSFNKYRLGNVLERPIKHFSLLPRAPLNKISVQKIEMDPTPLAAALKSDAGTPSMDTTSPALVDTPPRGRILYDPSSSPPRNGFRETYRHRLFPTPSPPDSPVFVSTAGEVSLSPTASETSETVSGGQEFSTAIASLRKLALRGSSKKAIEHDEDFDKISDLDLNDHADVESEDSSNDEFFDTAEQFSEEDKEESQPEYFDVQDEEASISNEGPLTGEQQSLLAGALHGDPVVEIIRQRCPRMHDRLYGEYQNLDFAIRPSRSVHRSRWTRRR
ncbi:hypothetical protein MMC17_004796 [Xylographa soralifera]|nr:hypothetical protein [Xylographa soralifera]